MVDRRLPFLPALPSLKLAFCVPLLVRCSLLILLVTPRLLFPLRQEPMNGHNQGALIPALSSGWASPGHEIT
jgi:hypothetical protein